MRRYSTDDAARRGSVSTCVLRADFDVVFGTWGALAPCRALREVEDVWLPTEHRAACQFDDAHGGWAASKLKRDRADGAFRLQFQQPRRTHRDLVAAERREYQRVGRRRSASGGQDDERKAAEGRFVRDLARRMAAVRQLLLSLFVRVA